MLWTEIGQSGLGDQRLARCADYKLILERDGNAHLPAVGNHIGDG